MPALKLTVPVAIVAFVVAGLTAGGLADKGFSVLGGVAGGFWAVVLVMAVAPSATLDDMTLPTEDQDDGEA